MMLRYNTIFDIKLYELFAFYTIGLSVSLDFHVSFVKNVLEYVVWKKITGNNSTSVSIVEKNVYTWKIERVTVKTWKDWGHLPVSRTCRRCQDPKVFSFFLSFSQCHWTRFFIGIDDACMHARQPDARTHARTTSRHRSVTNRSHNNFRVDHTWR